MVHPFCPSAAAAAFFAALVLAAGGGAALAQESPCHDPQTQAEINRCAGAEYLAQDRRLNQVYAAYRARLPAPRVEKLAAAQNAWIAFRDADCRYAASGVADGSAYGMVLSGCLEERTRQRVKELEALASCKEGDAACPAPR